jgi:hypothetical protein
LKLFFSAEREASSRNRSLVAAIVGRRDRLLKHGKLLSDLAWTWYKWYLWLLLISDFWNKLTCSLPALGGGSVRHTLLSAHPLLYVGPLSLMILLGFAATIATVASLRKYFCVLQKSTTGGRF